jgi:hypothetical protein
MTAHTSVRRALVAAAGVALALLGASQALAAGPVQTDDHHKNQFVLDHADTQCDTSTGKWRITWTLTNKWNRDANIKEVTSEPAGDVTVGDPAVPLEGAVVPQKDHDVNGLLTATQLLPGDATSAKLSFTVVWMKEHGKPNDGVTDKVSETVRFSGDCKPTEQCVKASAAHYAHTFDGPKGEASIRLTGDLPLCKGESQSFLLVSYYAPSASATWPQYKFDSAVGVIDAQSPTVDLKVQIPACYTQVDLVWGDELINPMVSGGARYGDRKLGSGGAPGNRSSGVPAWYNGGTKTCATPAATMVSACDGTVTVHLSNGGDAHYAAPFKVTAGLNSSFVKEIAVQPGQSADVVVPAESASKITISSDGDFIAEGMWQPGHCALPTVSAKSTCDTFVISVSNPEDNLPAEVSIAYGGETKKVTIQPGKTEEVSFPAGADKSEATVTFTDFEREVTLAYTKPSECASQSPSPSPSGSSPSVPGTPSPSSSSGPGLPVTGVQVGLIAGIAAFLVAGGAVLLLGARRRKLTEIE